MSIDARRDRAAPESPPPGTTRRRYFYGWNIVAVAALAQFSHTAGNNTTLGIFMPAMEQDLGASRAEISAISTIARLIEAFASPVIGPLLDRGWHKRLVVGGALVAGLGFILLGAIQTLWQLYLVKGLVVGLGLAGFGRLVTAVTVSNWFILKRGRALALSGLGGSGNALVLAPMSAWILTEAGWRWGWVALGLMIWIVVLIPSAIFLVRRPEDLGLLPDGRKEPIAVTSRSASTGAPAAIGPLEDSWTLSEALRTRTFWLLMITTGVGEMAQNAVNLHLFPYLYDLGYPPMIAVTVITVRGVLTVLSAPLWGFLAERFAPRWLLMAMFGLYAVGILVLMQAASLAVLGIAVAIYSMALAATGIVIEVAWAQYYGRRSLGAIRGFAMPGTVFLSALGPLAAGVLYTTTGSYTAAFWGIIGTATLSAVLMLACTPPRRGSG